MRRRSRSAPAGTGRSAPVRWAWMAIGGIGLVLGAVGLVVPLMPTTVFWILAALCFGRANPALRDRIYEHPHVGKTVEDFLSYGVICRHGKRAAIIGITISYVVVAATTAPGWPVLAGLGALLGAVVLWIARRPERRPHVPPAESAESAGARGP